MIIDILRKLDNFSTNISHNMLNHGAQRDVADCVGINKIMKEELKMTKALTMENYGFVEMNQEETLLINGGMGNQFNGEGDGGGSINGGMRSMNLPPPSLSLPTFNQIAGAVTVTAVAVAAFATTPVVVAAAARVAAVSGIAYFVSG
jgi:hypothetical protein